ncbi:MAG: sterol desaturase family protein [Acidobacteriota bacterium]|nr:sterol desaturase family protein [Acidobacteriota bacterium]
MAPLPTLESIDIFSRQGETVVALGRTTIWLAALLALSILETLWPRRPRHQPRAVRWPTNLALPVIGTLVVRLFAPLAPVAMAAWTQAHHGGLLPLLPGPRWLPEVIALVLLDLAIWLQHLAFHHLPFLWRWHLVHHTEEDLDATSGTRFHPAETLISAFYKLLVIAVLGPAPETVILFEILLNLLAVFNHANLALPASWDRALRLLIVTPDMHRTHHSVIRREQDSNFGFNLSLWDRLFGTYVADPRGGQRGLRLGVRGVDPSRGRSLLAALALPLRPDPRHADADQPTGGGGGGGGGGAS